MNTIIKVFGCGGGGSNAVNRMIDHDFSGVEFIAANTDCQSLNSSRALLQIKLGEKSARGLGAGGRSGVGEQAAEESANQIAEALQGADMVFVTAGMGGGTGTGAAPVVARLAREAGATVIGVVTTPFKFEGQRRMLNALGGIEKLSPHCHSLIVVPNEKLFELVDRKATFIESFVVADDLLRQCIAGLTELILKPGLINVDFANVKELMLLTGGTVFSVGMASGGNKACEAVKEAFNNKLLEREALCAAQGLIVHFKGSHELSLNEIKQAMEEVNRQLCDEVQIVMGATLDEMMGDRVQVTLVATGVGGRELEEPIAVELVPATVPVEVEVAATPVETATPLPSPVYQPIFTNSFFANATSPKPTTTFGESHAQWEMAAQQIAKSSLSKRTDLDLPAFLRRQTMLKVN